MEETVIGVKYKTFDIGLLYDGSETINIGIIVKNIYGLNSSAKNDTFGLPKYASIGISYKKGKYLCSFDNEVIFGKYGGLVKKTARFWFIRAGFEAETVWKIDVRIGLIFPVVAYTSDLGNLTDDIPSPRMGGTLGFGREFKHFILDFAAYGDIAESYVEEEIKLSAVGSVILKF